MKTIYLAAGCFWGSQAFYSQMIGIKNTSVGYANGDSTNPSYQDLCSGRASHAETVKIEYDETEISLLKILDYYLSIINPYSINRQGNDIGRQNRTGIFYENAEEEEIIKKFLYQKEQEYKKGPFQIVVEPLANFYLAEDYHQNYLEKNPNGYCHIKLDSIKKEDKKS